jgi:hypothetical protein
VPDLDLSKYDLLTAKEVLFAYITAKARAWGMNPEIECALWAPGKAAAMGYSRLWHIVWDAGPNAWGINLSLGGQTFRPEGEPWDMDAPEVVMGRPDGWYLQPHYSCDVGFVPTVDYVEFEDELRDDALVPVTRFVEDALIREIARHPQLLRTLERRQFEKLIAELFFGLGYEVELTKQTRDGGKDIIAVKKVDSLHLRYLIECKRPDPGKLTAVSTVRELLGVKHDDLASKAVLVTTTDFTRDAKALIERHRWTLEGKVYDDILSWVDRYKAVKGI